MEARLRAMKCDAGEGVTTRDDDGWESEGWSAFRHVSSAEKEELRKLFESSCCGIPDCACAEAPRVSRPEASCPLASCRPASAASEDDETKRAGRPRKPVDEKQNPRAFRLSNRLERAFKDKAREQGFRSWQEWLRALGEREARAGSDGG